MRREARQLSLAEALVRGGKGGAHLARIAGLGGAGGLALALNADVLNA